MPSVHLVMESSPRITEETNASGALNVSRGVMKTEHTVAVTMLRLWQILPKSLNEELPVYYFVFHVCYQEIIFHFRLSCVYIFLFLYH
jgi:hypothetical protein